MNRIEAEARPFLTPLIEGTPIVLDHTQMASVARWIALKTMVIEHATPGTAVTTSALRSAFRLRGEIPPYFNIYLGSHAGGQWAALFRDSRCISYKGTEIDPPLGDAPNNVQSVTMYLGKVFAYVNAARVNDFTIEKGLTIPKLYRQRIWPFMNHEMVWPSEPVFTVAQVNDIANGLARLFKVVTTGWLPL